MPSITSWTRIEPDPGSDDLQASLSARVLDPVWMLTRQWQVGEFQGEDADLKEYPWYFEGRGQSPAVISGRRFRVERCGKAH